MDCSFTLLRSFRLILLVTYITIAFYNNIASGKYETVHCFIADDILDLLDLFKKVFSEPNSPNLRKEQSAYVFLRDLLCEVEGANT